MLSCANPTVSPAVLVLYWKGTTYCRMGSHWFLLWVLNTGSWFLPPRNLIDERGGLGIGNFSRLFSNSLLIRHFFKKQFFGPPKMLQRTLPLPSPRFSIVNILLNFLPLLLICVVFLWHIPCAAVCTSSKGGPSTTDTCIYNDHL